MMSEAAQGALGRSATVRYAHPPYPTSAILGPGTQLWEEGRRFHSLLGSLAGGWGPSWMLMGLAG